MMKGLYYKSLALMVSGSLLASACIGSQGYNSSSQQNSIETPNALTAQVPSLEQIIWSKVSADLQAGELTYSRLYRAFEEGMAYSGTYPPNLEDGFSMDMPDKIDSFLSDRDLEVRNGVLNGYVFSKSTPEDSISSLIQLDIQLYSDLHDAIKYRLKKEYGDQKIPHKEFSDKIIIYSSFLVQDFVGYNRTYELAQLLISTLKEKFNVMPKYGGNSI